MSQINDPVGLNKPGGEPTDAIEMGNRSAPPNPPGTARIAGSGRRLATGLLFIGPNILGFLSFTLLPLVFAMGLAFTNWDLAAHNKLLEAQGQDKPLEFIGFDNFVSVLTEPVNEDIGDTAALWGLFGEWKWNSDFWQYFGNTLFFMMGMPLGIALSLLSAIALSQKLGVGASTGPGEEGNPHKRALWTFAAIGSGLLLLGGAMITFLTWSAAPDNYNGMPMLLCGLAAVIMLLGVAGGQTVYRTLFYMPHFVAGVATFLLWKKIFNTQTGPLTKALEPPLGALGNFVNALPAWLVGITFLLPLLSAAALAIWALNKLRRDYRDGELGSQAALIPAGLLLIPAFAALGFFDVFTGYKVNEQVFVGVSPWVLQAAGGLFTLVAFLAAAWLLSGIFSGQIIKCPRKDGGGGALMFGGVFMVLQFVLIGFAAVLFNLPTMANDGGLAPPQWLADLNWAKPSIMMMGLWAAIGGQTMLLYIAALTNVPQELYEAADIDGAGKFNKFWNVTWPQLAPTTFFVVVMGVIGGLQGGFEMARVMTQGGPSGQTTTLSYFIYEQGFNNTRLAYAAAASWIMFFFVLTVTLFNWKFGNQYVND
jgi:multiple sugar transport system permease protein